jgi:DNA repair protein RadC
MKKDNFQKLKVQVQLVRDKRLTKPVVIESPKEIYKLVKDEIQRWDREHFLAVMLDVRNGVIGIDEVSCGSVRFANLRLRLMVNSNIVHPREVFKAAILANAVSIVVIHNHPSGDVEPSEDDIEITRRLVEASKILGIEVIDHLIVSKEGYYSFKDAGLI